MPYFRIIVVIIIIIIITFKLLQLALTLIDVSYKYFLQHPI